MNTFCYRAFISRHASACAETLPFHFGLRLARRLGRPAIYTGGSDLAVSGDFLGAKSQ
jgi:hypothetical protein